MWTITYFYNPSVIESNPWKDRTGYNNFCVGWDTPPAVYPAAFLMTFIVYGVIKYNVDSLVRAACNPTLDPWRLAVVRGCSLTFAISACFLPLLLVVTPSVSPNWHTAFFVFYIIGHLFAVVGNFLECAGTGIPRAKWVFLGVYGFISLAFVFQLFVNFSYYEGPGVSPTLPPALAQFCDYGWFACLAVIEKVLPSQQKPLKITYELSV